MDGYLLKPWSPLSWAGKGGWGLFHAMCFVDFGNLVAVEGKGWFVPNISRCCVLCFPQPQRVTYGYLELIVPRALKFKGPEIKWETCSGLQTAGTMQICSSSLCDAVKLRCSKIIWQTQLMPVILLQNSSTDLFQASQIFMYPEKHQTVGFFASSEFCIDNTCFCALLFDMKTLFFVSFVKIFSKEYQLLKM